jgi:hypothetical protein
MTWKDNYIKAIEEREELEREIMQMLEDERAWNRQVYLTNTQLINLHDKHKGYEYYIKNFGSDFVYIGRFQYRPKAQLGNIPKSIWANPFPAKNHTYQEHSRAVDLYRQYIIKRPDLLAQLHTLKNKILGCWCVPLPCHGNVLIELLNT